MCEPTTIITGTMAAVNLASNMFQGFSSASAEDYNAEAAEQNAAIEGYNAEYAEMKGKESARQHLQQVNLLKGSQRASLGASGVLVDSGSTEDVLMDTTEQGALDAVTIRHNAALQAHQHRVRQQSYNDQADLYKHAAKNYRTQGIISGAVLGGVGALGGAAGLAGAGLFSPSAGTGGYQQFFKYPKLSGGVF